MMGKAHAALNEQKLYLQAAMTVKPCFASPGRDKSCPPLLPAASGLNRLIPSAISALRSIEEQYHPDFVHGLNMNIQFEFLPSFSKLPCAKTLVAH